MKGQYLYIGAWPIAEDLVDLTDRIVVDRHVKTP